MMDTTIHSFFAKAKKNTWNLNKEIIDQI